MLGMRNGNDDDDDDDGDEDDDDDDDGDDDGEEDDGAEEDDDSATKLQVNAADQRLSLSKPVQSKCRSTCHKSIRKFTGKMAFPRTATPCEVERHVEISQEPLYTEIYRRNAGAKKLAQPKRMQDCTRATSHRNLKQNAGAQNPRPILRASLRSRNACQDFTRATLDGNLQVKYCRPKPRRTLCASLRRRNACHKSRFAQRFT